MAVPTGTSIPPPKPCRMRKTVSWVNESARPHSMDAPVNTARASRKTRLVPKRSPNQPEAGIETASASR